MALLYGSIMKRFAAACLFAGLLLFLSSCHRKTPSEVVIYSSIDDPYLRPLMRRFETQTGITVRIVTDTEAAKSSTLVERLLAEKANPQADVSWGNAPFHAITLAEQGVFDAYRPASAKDIPPRWREAPARHTHVGPRERVS